MNGAADSYHRQEEENQQGLRSCSEGRGFDPGYNLDMTSHPQHSKTMNFDNHSVDAYEYKHGDQYSNSRDYRSVYNNCYEGSQNHQYRVPVRVPLDLPVPKFEIDENCVGEPIWRTNSVSLPTVENSNELDLDTRINLLIKTKALAGMHPIFSQLESESESDGSLPGSLRSKKKKRRTRSPPAIEHIEHFDDPEMPLSRPPSPFLTRASYLFWFNKAIELKKQAKAQEQELLEKAAKKLLQEHSTSGGKTEKNNSNHKITLPKNVLDEVCSELKEIVKNEFIKEVFEDAVFNTLEQWWESNCQKNTAVDTLHTSPIGNNTSSEISSINVIKNDVIKIPPGENEICSSEMKMNEILKPQEEMKEKLFDHNSGANVYGQACLISLEAIDNSVESSRSTTTTSLKDSVSDDESYCGHQSFKRNVIPRINQPILDESSLFLPFPTSSESSEVPIERLDTNDKDMDESVNVLKDKNDCVVNVINTILENVFQTVGI